MECQAIIDNQDIDIRIPRYISLMTCDSNSLWFHCASGFRRKFVDEELNSSDNGIPFNDDFYGGSHLCFHIHKREDEASNSRCQLPGGQLIQKPASREANVFNTVYWRRCDGTSRNALDETLKNDDGSDRMHGMFRVRFKDVIMPWPEYRLSKMKVEEYEKDLERFEKYKDAFVTRFM